MSYLDPATRWPRGLTLSEPSLTTIGTSWSTDPAYSLSGFRLRSASRFAADFDPFHLALRFGFAVDLRHPATAAHHLGFGVGDL